MPQGVNTAEWMSVTPCRTIQDHTGSDGNVIPYEFISEHIVWVTGCIATKRVLILSTQDAVDWSVT